MARPERRRKVLGGVALAATIAGAAGVAIQQKHAMQLNDFLRRVGIKFEVMLETYRANLMAAARDGVNAVAAHEIMTYHPAYCVDSNGASVALSAVPRLSAPSRLDILDIHVMGITPLLQAIKDYVAKGNLPLPYAGYELLKGLDGDLIVVTFDVKDETVGGVIRGTNGCIDDDTITAVTAKLNA